MTCGAKRRQCGGCPYLETPYAEQLKRKQAEAMRQLGALGPVRPILGMKEPLHYRHKVIASFAQDARGVLYAGLYAQGSHHVVPVEDCALQDTRANALLRTVVMLAKECKWHAYEEDRREGLLRHVLIRTSWKRPEAMVTLVTSQPTLPGGKYFAARLRTLCPEVQTLTQSVNARATSVVLGAQPRVLYGPGFIEDALCGMTFRLSPTAFYQVNPAQAEVLYKQAAAFASLTGRETVLDAYCGTGTIGLIVSPHARHVLGVECNAQAVRDAVQNAKRNGVTHAEFVAADAGDYLRAQAAQGLRPDVVLLDPPRTGSDARFLQSLAEMAPARVIYVSCSLETLARDVRMLMTRGYRLAAAQPVDMFPHTEHVECVGVLCR